MMLGAIALVALLVSAIFAVYIDPGITEWRTMMRIKRSCAQRLDQEKTGKIVFAGGSSTTFGVMPSVLKEKYGINAVNAGLHAGSGAGFLILWACTLLEPGDTLVLMVEPGLFRYRFQPQPQTLMEVGMPKEYWRLKGDLYRNDRMGGFPQLQSLRPSGAVLTGLVGKFMRGQALAGYRVENMDSYGTLTAKPARPGKLRADDLSRLSENLDESLTEDGVFMLDWVKEFCAKKGVKMCYIYPQIWVTPDAVDAYNQRAKLFAKAIGCYMPVLNPDRFATAHGELFLDSILHLNPVGARLFSEEIGRLLIDGGYVPVSQAADKPR